MAEGRGGVEAELALNLSVSCSVGMNMAIEQKKILHRDLKGPTAT
jgi:hypothetical protein